MWLRCRLLDVGNCISSGANTNRYQVWISKTKPINQPYMGTLTNCSFLSLPWQRNSKSQEPGRCYFTKTHLTPESPLQAQMSKLEESGGHRRRSSRQKRGCDMASWERERERQQLIQGEIRAEVEEERHSKTVTMHQQGAWTNWDKEDHLVRALEVRTRAGHVLSMFRTI